MTSIQSFKAPSHLSKKTAKAQRQQDLPVDDDDDVIIDPDSLPAPPTQEETDSVLMKVDGEKDGQEEAKPKFKPLSAKESSVGLGIRV